MLAAGVEEAPKGEGVEAAGALAAPNADEPAGVAAAPKGEALGAAAAAEAPPKENAADPPLAPAPNEKPKKKRFKGPSTLALFL